MPQERTWATAQARRRHTTRPGIVSVSEAGSQDFDYICLPETRGQEHHAALEPIARGEQVRIQPDHRRPRRVPVCLQGEILGKREGDAQPHVALEARLSFLFDPTRIRIVGAATLDVTRWSFASGIELGAVF
jgi:hypothetical protein